MLSKNLAIVLALSCFSVSPVFGAGTDVHDVDGTDAHVTAPKDKETETNAVVTRETSTDPNRAKDEALEIARLRTNTPGSSNSLGTQSEIAKKIENARISPLRKFAETYKEALNPIMVNQVLTPDMLATAKVYSATLVRNGILSHFRGNQELTVLFTAKANLNALTDINVFAFDPLTAKQVTLSGIRGYLKLSDGRILDFGDSYAPSDNNFTSQLYWRDQVPALDEWLNSSQPPSPAGSSDLKNFVLNNYSQFAQLVQRTGSPLTLDKLQQSSLYEAKDENGYPYKILVIGSATTPNLRNIILFDGLAGYIVGFPEYPEKNLQGLPKDERNFLILADGRMLIADYEFHDDGNNGNYSTYKFSWAPNIGKQAEQKLNGQ